MKPDSIKGQILRRLEGLGLRLPDRLIADTSEYVKFHCKTYGLAPARFELVAAGADERTFYPRPELNPPEDSFRIIYYGTFIPNHGVMTMVESAALLRDHECIAFGLYGDGPDAAAAIQYAATHDLENVTFHGWADKEALPAIMAQAHLCLGVFGTTPQSMMTVQNKIWEAAAMARPLVSGDSPAVRAAFSHGQDIYLVERNDPRALADAIIRLKKEPALREQIAANAYQHFLASNSTKALGKTFRNVIDRLIADA